MRDPGRLRVVEVALRVATLTYAATKQFPVAEWQGMVPQMRRAAVSIGSNITEGRTEPSPVCPSPRAREARAPKAKARRNAPGQRPERPAFHAGRPD
jgi:hypothetical protein